MKSNKNNVSIKNTESVCNMLGNVHIPTLDAEWSDYPMPYWVIALKQPEKIENLKAWFEVTNCYPNSNSTPVFDATEMKVYPSTSLDRSSKDPHYPAVKHGVENSIWNKIPYFPRNHSKDIYGHSFIPVSQVDLVILREALDSYITKKEESEKKLKTLEALSKTLETLQKEIAELKNS